MMAQQASGNWQRSRGISALAVCLLLMVPVLVYANAGVPMIIYIMPVMGFSLIPIILIEAWYLHHRLSLSTTTVLKVTTLSNLLSTLVGVPLTWLLLVVVQMLLGGGGAFGLETTWDKLLSVTFQSAWLIPYAADLNWMIPLAGLFLLVPCFLVSWWSELWLTRRLLKTSAQYHELKTVVRNANLITYGLLALWPLAYGLLN
jgi:hypothetical protein